ncbi:hypothetical protein C8Q76DRAFT_746506 [Earliella scabrosa]|nr:hypothetical protein C8Q76DRAFT_746506 [Earliella scabrosa]
MRPPPLSSTQVLLRVSNAPLLSVPVAAASPSTPTTTVLLTSSVSPNYKIPAYDSPYACLSLYIGVFSLHVPCMYLHAVHHVLPLAGCEGPVCSVSTCT